MIAVWLILGIAVLLIVATGWFVSIDFALRITEANPGFWDWMNPHNFFAWIVMFLAFGLALLIARFAIGLATGIVAFVSGVFVALICRNEDSGMTAAATTAMIFTLIARPVVAFFAVDWLFDYSTEHWSNLTGIFVNGQVWWKILIFTVLLFALVPTSENKND